MTKDKSIQAIEWLRNNVKDTDITLTDDSAKLFEALSVGGNLVGIKVSGNEQVWQLCSIQ